MKQDPEPEPLPAIKPYHKTPATQPYYDKNSAYDKIQLRQNSAMTHTLNKP